MRRAALAALATAAALSACGSEAERPRAAAVDAPARVSLQLRRSYPLAEEPGASAAGFGRVYAVNEPDGRVLAIDADDGSVDWARTHGRNHLDPAQNNITTGLGSVWVLRGFAGRIYRLDPETGTVQDSAPTVADQAINVAGDRVYVTSFQKDRVDVYDAGTLERVQSLPVPGPTGTTIAGDELFVSSASQQELWRFRLGETRPSARILLRQPYEKKGEPPGPARVEAAHGAIWVTDPLGNLVSRVPLDGSPTITIKLGVGSYPWGLAGDDDGVWVGSAGYLVHVDAATNKVNGVLKTLPDRKAKKADGPRDMSVADGALWVGEPLKARVTAYDIRSG